MVGAELWIFGAGGHAKVVIDCATSAGFSVVGVFDDDATLQGQRIAGAPVIGGRHSVDELLEARPAAYRAIAIGQNVLRRQLAEELPGRDAPAMVHARAWVERSVSLGDGTVVFAGAVINADAKVGAQVIVNTAASLDHDCVVCDFVHIAPGARVCGGVHIGARTLVGAGSIVVPGVRIGDDCVIGAGSVVLGDVPSGQVFAGNPARER